MTGEFLFDETPDEKAEEIFSGLANTGQIARLVLNALAPDRVGSWWRDHKPKPF